MLVVQLPDPTGEEHTILNTYLSNEEAAKFIGVSAQSLKQARYEGSLVNREPPPYYAIGLRKVVYKISDLVEWVEAAPKRAFTGQPDIRGKDAPPPPQRVNCPGYVPPLPLKKKQSK